MKSTLPALCAELRMRDDAGVPVVNSRDVAEFFGKRHPHVLRDIDDLLAGGLTKSGHTPWFRETELINGQNGQTYRSFDLTRQGFTLLVMGWTGAKATEFKVRYIEAFDALEAALRTNVPAGTEIAGMIIAGLKQAIAPLAVRFDYTDSKIDKLETGQLALSAGQAVISERVARIESTLNRQRKKNFSQAAKDVLVLDTARLGGRCPCCGVAEVIDTDGRRSPFADFDHFYQTCDADANNGWLICKPCHSEITDKRISRDHRAADFKSFQDKRRRLPGRQMSLFG